MSIPKLSPCPFCGDSPSFKNELGFHDNPLDFTVEDGRIVWGVWLECNGCGCTLGMGCQNSQECNEGYFSTLEEAASAWNSRD